MRTITETELVYRIVHAVLDDGKCRNDYRNAVMPVSVRCLVSCFPL